MSTIKAGKIQPPGDSDPLQIFTNTVERITVTSGGLVGVGTVTPSVKLQTIDTYNAARFGHSNSNSLTIGSRAGGPYCGIGYNINFDSGFDDQYFAVGGDRTSLIRFQAGGFQFKGNNSVGAVSGTPFALTEYMTILSSGNVGIGNTNPVATLDVAGTLNVSGATTLTTATTGLITCATAPTAAGHLCNKTYVDHPLRIGSVFSFILPSGGFATTAVTTAMNSGYVMPPGWIVTSPYTNSANITWTVPANSGAWVGWWTAMNNTNTHGNISWTNSGSTQTITVPASVYNNTPFFMTVRRVS